MRNLLTCILASLLLAAPASAAAILYDDFESGHLGFDDMPPPGGKWDGYPVQTNCSIGPGSGAANGAHRGNFGMFFVDSHNVTGSGLEGEVFGGVNRVTPTVYGRFWFRTTQSNGLGRAIVAQLSDVSPNEDSVLDLAFNPGVSGGTFEISGQDNGNVTRSNAVPFPLTLGRWYLVEFEVKGIGSSSGSLKGYIDGVLKASVNLNLTGRQSSTLTLGEPASPDRTFTGQFQFDDYRADTAPLASRWTLSAAPGVSASTGGCLPITATLINSINGAATGAPFALTATLSRSGSGGAFFSDPACATPSTTLSVASGAQGGTIYFKPTEAGSTTLTVREIDFLDGSLTLQIPAGSSDDGTGAPAPPSGDGGPVAANPVDPGATPGGTDGHADPSNCPADNPFCGDQLQIGSSCAAGANSDSGPILGALVAWALARSLRRTRRNRGPSLLLALAALTLTLASAPAEAALFADDFETGTLVATDTPAGKWTSTIFNASCPSPGSCTLAATAAAARRGGFGFELVDNATPTGGGTQAEIRAGLAPQTTLFGRFWFRAAASNGSGSVVLAQIIAGSGNAALDLKLGLANNTLAVGGFDTTGTYREESTQFVVDLNGWHLMEFQVSGLGTASGALRGWVDGTLRVQLTGVDLSSLQSDDLRFGEPFSDDRRFAGRLHFDDFRLDNVPQASKWALTGPVLPPPVGSCVPFSATLQNSLNGAPAAAPYPVVASLTNTGATGSFFSDSGCTAPTTTLTIGAGGQAAVVYFKPTATGIASLSVAHLDFLGATAVLQVLGNSNNPGGGTDGGVSQTDAGALAGCPPENPFCGGDIEVGSACAASDGEAAAALGGGALIAWAVLRRGKRRHD